MTYEKHEWKNDEVITAERLNSIEDGLDRSINISNSPSILKSGDILTFQRGSQMLGLQYKKEYVKVNTLPYETDIDITNTEDYLQKTSDFSIRDVSVFKELNFSIVFKQKVPEEYSDLTIASPLFVRYDSPFPIGEKFYLFSSVSTVLNLISGLFYVDFYLSRDSSVRSGIDIRCSTKQVYQELSEKFILEETRLVYRGLLPIDS